MHGERNTLAIRPQAARRGIPQSQPLAALVMAIVLAGGELAAQGHQPSSMSIRHLPSLNAAKPSLSGASQVGNLPKQSQRFGRPTVVPAQSFSEVVPSSARLNQQPPQQSEVRFAQAAQPEAVQPPTLEVIPTPGLSPAPQSSRGSLLLGLPPELRTPRPTPEVERRFGQFVEGSLGSLAWIAGCVALTALVWRFGVLLGYLPRPKKDGPAKLAAKTVRGKASPEELVSSLRSSDIEFDRRYRKAARRIDK